MRWLLIGVIAGFGCVYTSTTTCSDGGVCRSGTECFTLSTLMGNEVELCVSEQDRAACEGKAEGDACDLAGGTGGGACHQGVCVVAICGNGLIDPGEVCDDENTSNDDECSADCSSTLACGNSTLDMILGEQCDTGDALGHDGCNSTCQLERPHWVQTLGDRPGVRDQAAMAYDLNRRRTVLFGGARNGVYPLDDTSEWDGQRWRASASAITPSSRYAHTMAYDEERGELVVFSGVNNQADTWVTTQGIWQQRVTAHAPPKRDYGGMVYDRARKQVVLFGGFGVDTQEALDDTWAWDGVDWHELSPPTHPPALLAFGMAYDPIRNVTVLFGGTGTVFVREDKVWEFDGTTWADRTPSQRPTPRVFSRMAFDPTTGEVMMTGGNDGSNSNDVHTWNGTRWLQRASLPGSSGAFNAHAMATDPARQRVIVLATDGTLYEWSGSAWLAPVGGAPAVQPEGRHGPAMILDPLRDEVVMFGGETLDTDPTYMVPNAETYVWNGGWTQAAVTGPSARWGAAFAYDEVHHDAVLYGGCITGDAFADTWVWQGGEPAGTWAPRPGSSQPGKRCLAAMAFDAKRRNLVLVGGTDSSNGSFATGTWTFDGTTWTQAPTATTPPRYGSALGYDRVREQIILFGGRVPGTTTDADETWAWDGNAWTKLAPITVPGPRSDARLAWDPARARLVLAGGVSTEANYTYDDAYEWDGTNWIPMVAGYNPRRGAGMTTAPDGAGILMFGGDGVSVASSPHVPLSDVLSLRWDGDVSYEACTDKDGDGDAKIGCLDPDCWWICTPTCPPGTTCDPAAPGCGDQVCNPALEACYSCPADCGVCP